MGQQRGRGVCITQEGLALLEEARGEKRDELGKVWTYAVLATAVGISERTLRSFRQGEPIDKSTVLQICGALGLQLDQLVDLGQAALAERKPNPFGRRDPVMDPAAFWGRKELLRQVFEELDKGGSRALIGPTGSGKSSILQMICRLGPEELGRLPEEFLYLDMHSIRDEAGFFEELCHLLDIREPCSQTRIGRELQKRPCRYVICLDAIDVLEDEAFFPKPTQYWLRSTAESKEVPVQWVLSSRGELRDLFPDNPHWTSPLADFFDGQTTRLGYLSEAEVMVFWEQGLAGTGVVVSPGQGRRLWAESQGELRTLQQAAAKLYDELTGRS